MNCPKAESHKSSLYHQLSNLYEPVFARFFRDRARAAIQEAQIPSGAKVLEIGVGTGLALDAYPEHCRVVGCDLSQEMLELAQAKVTAKGWQHIELRQMDAQNLTFADNTFDFVMAFHVVTVVPDPAKMISEMVRVAKPNAKIVIVNHFRSHRQWIAALIDRLDPVTRHLGWRTNLSLEDAIRNQMLQVEERFKTAPNSLFNVVVLRKTPTARAASVPHPSIRRIHARRRAVARSARR
jgi:phosphatidylethanolamine/phosphatidyl-N-methylethanolamine N-methyltransferase